METIFSAVVFLAVVFLMLGIVFRKEERLKKSEQTVIGEIPQPVNPHSGLGMFVQAFRKLLGPFYPNENMIQNIESKLRYANFRKFSGEEFIVGRFILILIGMLAGLLAPTLLEGVMYGILGGVIGYLLPIWWMNRSIQKRKKEAKKYLRFSELLLAALLQRGADFRSAMKEVSLNTPGEFGMVLKHVHYQLSSNQMGFADAIRLLTEEYDFSEMDEFVTTILHAHRYGKSIADSLIRHIEDMDYKTELEIDEMSKTMSTRMLMVILFGILAPSFVFGFAFGIISLTNLIQTL